MSDNKQKSSAPGSAEQPSQRTDVAAHVCSKELFGNAQELVIEHNQREYRLRVTARGKLILTA